MITTERVGRDLHIHVEGVEAPYVIRPLPGRAGVQITDTFLGNAGGLGNANDLAEALMIAVDGAQHDPDKDRWLPVPVDQQTNYTRIGMELRQAEAESVLMPAFFWQSALGDDALRLYLEGGEGIPGSLKATGALAARLRLLVSRTSPLSASVNLMTTGSTPTTFTRPGGKKSGSGKRKPR